MIFLRLLLLVWMRDDLLKATWDVIVELRKLELIGGQFSVLHPNLVPHLDRLLLLEGHVLVP